jgi:putative endonuclease
VPRQALHITVGKQAEIAALKHLQEQGMILVAKNFSCRYGEIDLIMKDRKVLVFVEVRYRKNDSYGSGAESITFSKRKRIITTAGYFLAANKLENTDCRFDVVSANGPVNTGMQLHWIKDAFEE